nr:unnamed protein product [Callosobruchus chinensis]
MLVTSHSSTLLVTSHSSNNISLFYRYSNGACSSELSAIIPLPTDPTAFHPKALLPLPPCLYVMQSKERQFDLLATSSYFLADVLLATSHYSTDIQTDSAPPS